MNSYPSRTLLHCKNPDEIPFVVLGFNNSIDVYSSDMTFLKGFELPFRPFQYLVVSKKGLLVFGIENKNGYADLETGIFTENRSPLGTSINKDLMYSSIYETDGGFVFFPHDTGCQTKTFFYYPSENKFKRIEIELPDDCFASQGGKHGWFFCRDEDRNFQACSFKTAYLQKRFVPEMKVSHDLLSCYYFETDVFSLASRVACVSIEKDELILVSQDKPDAAALDEYIKNVCLVPTDSSALEFLKRMGSGKVVLIKNGAIKKTIELNEMPFQAYSYPFSDSVLLVSHGGVLDAYSTDDLTLLASFQSAPMKIINLPDGRMVYEIDGDTYLSDSSPLAIATKKLEELKRGR